MAGVVDDNGVQWEHCHACFHFVRLENLGYERPSDEYPLGRDMCVTCVDTGIKTGLLHFDEVEPAPSWQVYEID